MRKKQLKFRGKKSLKWIPFKGLTIKVKDDAVFYNGHKFRVWNSLKIKGKIKSGCFTQDSLGRWFVSFTYEAPLQQTEGIGEVGIDLGLKTTAVCTNGKELELKSLDEWDQKIANLQRARKFKRAKVIHKKKTNIRKDKINKFALDLVKSNNLIAIGNVHGFTKGNLAKSRYQNSWSLLKNVLEFKSLEYGVSYKEVSEKFSTQTCSECGSIEGPRGLAGLSVRFWVCSCGVGLKRDVNSAIIHLNRAKCLAS